MKEKRNRNLRLNYFRGEKNTIASVEKNKKNGNSIAKVLW